MMIFSIMNFAQFERKQTSERVSANFQSRAQRGLFNGGHPPLGYNTHPEKKGLLTINEKEASQVRRIFQIFLEEGRVVPTILRLKEEGIKTKKRIRSDGAVLGAKEWKINSLWGLLTNRHLIGEREINKKSKAIKDPTGFGKKSYSVTEAQWLAIISKSTFEKHNTSDNPIASKKSHNSKSPLITACQNQYYADQRSRTIIHNPNRGRGEHLE